MLLLLTILLGMCIATPMAEDVRHRRSPLGNLIAKQLIKLQTKQVACADQDAYPEEESNTSKLRGHVMAIILDMTTTSWPLIADVWGRDSQDFCQ